MLAAVGARVRIAAAILLVTMIPAVGAHGEAWTGDALAPGTYLQHNEVRSVTVAPDETVNISLAFAGAPLQASWLLIFTADVNGTLDASLVDDGLLAEWSWNSGRHEETVRVQHTGWPQLIMHNPGHENASVMLFFDQTCDCIGKVLPTQSGPLLFNVDASEGRRVSIDFTAVPTRRAIDSPDGPFIGSMLVNLKQIRASSDGHSYDVLREWQWTGSDSDWDNCRGIDRIHACIDIDYYVEEGGRQTFILYSSHDMDDWVVQVRPIIEIGPPRALNVPVPLPLIMTGVCAAALLARAASAVPGMKGKTSP